MNLPPALLRAYRLTSAGGRAADLVDGMPRPAKTPRPCEEAPGHVVMEDHIGKPMDIIVIY